MEDRHLTRRGPRAIRTLAAAISAATLSACLIAGCGSGRLAAPAGTVVNVTEHDFHIATSVATVHAGTTTFQVDNAGPDQHEFIVARAAGPEAFPMRGDGFTIDEDAIAHSEPGALDPAAPGAYRKLTVSLTPGRYVLFCNMSGHFMAGMHTVLVVKP